MEVALACEGAGALVAALGDLPVAALSLHAYLVVVAVLTALTAVARVGLCVDAGVVALLRACHAVCDAYACLAARGRASACVADHAAVLRARLQVDAEPVVKNEARTTAAVAVVAVVGGALALVVA